MPSPHAAAPDVTQSPSRRCAPVVNAVSPLCVSRHRDVCATARRLRGPSSSSKYGGDKAALRALAALTSGRLGHLLTAVPDAVIAVPLGSRRRRQRGYNQSEIIAGVIASERGVLTCTGLERVRDTPPQSERDEGARRRNVAGAFAWRGASLASARLWLVDDVLTTGATIEAAAAALEDAGAARIDVIVVAVVP
jgi:ComF family protein